MKQGVIDVSLEMRWEPWFERKCLAYTFSRHVSSCLCLLLVVFAGGIGWVGMPCVLEEGRGRERHTGLALPV